MRTISYFYFSILFFFLGFSCNKVLADNTQSQIDSIKLETLNTKNDSTRVLNYSRIARLYININRDSADYYFKKSISYAQKTKNQKGTANGYFNQGVFYFQTERFDKSLKSYLSALEVYKQIKDSANISGVYTNMGILYSFGYNKQASIDYYIKSLNICRLLKDSAGIANNLNNIGLIYIDLKNYPQAIDYLNRTLSIDLLSGNEENIAHTYNNLARLYLNNKQYEEADTNLVESYKRIEFVKDADLKIEILSCAGEFYLETNKPDSALKFIREALNIANQFNRKRTLAYTYFLIGRYLMLENDYPIAIKHINSAIRLSDSLNIKDKSNEYYNYISKAYFKLGEYKNAYNNLEKSYAITDSLKLDDVSKSLGEFEKQMELVKIQNQFQFDQLEKQNELEKSNLKIKLLTQFFSLVIVLLVSIVIIVNRNNRNKVKANKNLQEKNEIIEQQSEELKNTIEKLEENEKTLERLNATKDKFFSIIAHDLKNPFNVLIGYTDLLMNEPEIVNDPEKLKKVIKSLNSTAEFSYELLENLLTWSRSQSGTLKVNKQSFNFSEMISSNIAFFQEMANSKGIKINFDTDEEINLNTDKDMLFSIVRNLIHNAVKFTKPGGQIEVKAINGRDKMIVSVSDDGIGITREDQKKLFRIDSNFKVKGTADESGTGLGLILCHEFITKNNGEISVKSEIGKGSIFTFTLPITN